MSAVLLWHGVCLHFFWQFSLQRNFYWQLPVPLASKETAKMNAGAFPADAKSSQNTLKVSFEEVFFSCLRMPAALFLFPVCRGSRGLSVCRGSMTHPGSWQQDRASAEGQPSSPLRVDGGWRFHLPSTISTLL